MSEKSEILSKLTEDMKEETYEGYKSYRKNISLDSLVGISYNFDSMKVAIDTLFRKCYENEQGSVE